MADRKQASGRATQADPASLPLPVVTALARLCEAVRTNDRTYRYYQGLARRLQGATRGQLVDVVEAMREE